MPHPANEFYAHEWPHKEYIADGKPAVGDSVTNRISYQQLPAGHACLADRSLWDRSMSMKQRVNKQRQELLNKGSKPQNDCAVDRLMCACALLHMIAGTFAELAAAAACSATL